MEKQNRPEKISYLVDFSCSMLADNNTKNEFSVAQLFENDPSCKNMNTKTTTGSEDIIKTKTFVRAMMEIGLK